MRDIELRRKGLKVKGVGCLFVDEECRSNAKCKADRRGETLRPVGFNEARSLTGGVASARAS